MSEETPTNAVTNGVATGRTAFDFAYDVANKAWEGPGKWGVGVYQDGNAIRELKMKLGEWVDEAQDDQGRWQQPILTEKAFKAHLMKQDGEIQPSGECKSSFGWAKLLYAFNIRPRHGQDDSGVISWTNAEEGEASPAMTGTVSLAIQGAALCHIINVYQNYAGTTPQGTFSFPFGDITTVDKSKRLYKFKDHGKAELSSRRQPFPYSMRDRGQRREGYLNLGPGIAVALYFETLDNDISEIKGKLPDIDDPLLDRVKSLTGGMDLLTQRNWDKPYLITPFWIDHATRIKRRATTNGGKDDLLMRHIIRYISNDSDTVNQLRAPLRNEEMWEDLLKSTVRDMFMFSQDKYEFMWNRDIELSSKENPTFVAVVRETLPRALERLTETNEGRFWARTFTPPVPAEFMLNVLKTPHRVLNRPVIVLQHNPDEWNFLGELSG